MTRARRFVLDADHDPVGLLEIVDRRALAQELRVRDDGEALARRASPMIRSIASQAPIGEVDLLTTTT